MTIGVRHPLDTLSGVCLHAAHGALLYTSNVVHASVFNPSTPPQP